MNLDTFADLRRELDRRISPQHARCATGHSLERMHRLLEGLGHPERGLPAVHVAGSKGKGSTCAAIASALHHSGWQVGLFTSPHMVDPRERIRIGPRPAPDRRWVAAGARVLAQPAAAEATWYELVVAIGFELFREAQVDAAVIEVGLGGRLDATNLLDAPLACAIGRISCEHTAILGEDLATIAREKAGILKPGVPAVIAPDSAEAEAAIAAEAARVGAPLWRLGHEVQLSDEADLQVRTPRGSHRVTPPACVPTPSAALALALADLVAERSGRPIANAAAGVAAVTWPGRRQWLPGPPPLLVDCAHEAASAAALRTVYGERPPAVLMLGVLRDKPLAAILDALLPLAREVIVCEVDSPRALPTDELAAAVRARGVPVLARPSPVRALSEVQRRAAAADCPGVICGSVYLAGAALAALGVDCEPAFADAPELPLAEGAPGR